LFTGDDSLAYRLAEKLLSECRGGVPSTPFEIEASCIQYWTSIVEFQSNPTGPNTGPRRKWQDLNSALRGRTDVDVDLLMMWARSKQLQQLDSEAINVFNQVIAAYPWFTAGLVEKALLLADAGEWEQALDTVQRALDIEPDNIDALKLIAVHAFVQESQPHDALQKLEDVDSAIAKLEPSSVSMAIETARLFSVICSRHPRALQICIRMMERVQKLCANNEEEASLQHNMGHVYLMQGMSMYERAMRAFKEATKRNPESIPALEGMILCQLYEGLYDDAEGQIELLTVMHR
jgi:tetratricopeptide (TPR) repeat protein